jgi:predicted dehydrogenase
MNNNNPLGIGFIGSGFITRFHIRSFIAVRHADVRGVYSPNQTRAAEAAQLARDIGVGDARAFSSIAELVAAPEIDCIWLCGPNHTRLANVEEIVSLLKAKKGKLIGIACEKPLAHTVADARRIVELIEGAGLLHGYLENQLFTPSVVRGKEIVWSRGAAVAGRPYLARAAEEHGGPHMPWFWQGTLQGGGVLSDMMCHSVEVARYLLTPPGAARNSIRPTKVSAQIACLKWARPNYAAALKKNMGPEIDYLKAPSEDFARASISFVDEAGYPLIVEATTSWGYVGAGLRLSMELLGPEYSLAVNSQDSGARVFFSRSVGGAAGEDLLEKQNAETGLMPVIGNEAAEYGYEGENRHMVESFRKGVEPSETFRDGLAVTELLMAAYMSAEQERVLEFPPPGLDTFVPAVARGEWSPAVTISK